MASSTRPAASRSFTAEVAEGADCGTANDNDEKIAAQSNARPMMRERARDFATNCAKNNMSLRNHLDGSTVGHGFRIIGRKCDHRAFRESRCYLHAREIL